MMRTITVKEGQTLTDIAIEYCGDYSAVYDIADLNGKGITDDLVIGEHLVVPDVINEDVVGVFDTFSPASAEDLNDSEIYGEGLEFWAIELDFIIS